MTDVREWEEPVGPGRRARAWLARHLSRMTWATLREMGFSPELERGRTLYAQVLADLTAQPFAAFVVWRDDAVFRARSPNGAWHLDAVAIDRAILERITAHGRRAEAQDFTTLEAWLRAELDGKLVAGPPERPAWELVEGGRAAWLARDRRAIVHEALAARKPGEALARGLQFEQTFGRSKALEAGAPPTPDEVELSARWAMFHAALEDPQWPCISCGQPKGTTKKRRQCLACDPPREHRPRARRSAPPGAPAAPTHHTLHPGRPA